MPPRERLSRRNSATAPWLPPSCPTAPGGTPNRSRRNRCRREDMAGDELACRVRLAGRGDPGRKIRGVIFVIRGAGEGPGASRRGDDGVDQKARNGDILRHLREGGAIGDR